MNTEDLAINNSANRKVIKHFSAVFPRVRVAIFSVDFIIEPIDCSNLSGFVVSSEEGDSIWVLYLEAKKVLECFH